MKATQQEISRLAPNPGSDLDAPSGLRELGASILIALALSAPVLLVGGVIVARSYDDLQQARAARLAAVVDPQAHESLLAEPPLAAIPEAVAIRGRDRFMSACIACHGPEGLGVTGLGKNLVESDFVASRSDAAFVAFIIEGRPTARPVPMPPRAGRDDLTDADLADIVAYIRALQDPRRMPALPAYTPIIAAPTQAEEVAALAAAGGDPELAAWIANGTKLFNSTCIACHGSGGVGITGNGKALAHNTFIQGQDDESLLAFIKRGRDPGDPANTTGIGMPPKGGNPALSEDDLLDIIAYLRTLQGAAPAGGNP